jgi:hypothetical protein
MFRSLPAFGGDQRAVAEVVRGIMDGKTNNTGTLTLATGGATTTNLIDRRIGPDSVIIFVPLSSAAYADSAPYGAFQDSTNQSVASTTSAYPVTFNTTDFTNGITLSSSSHLNVTNAGLYNLQFSIQLSNLANSTEDAEIWFRKNGTNIAGSNSIFGLAPRKNSTDPYHVIASMNYYVQLAANDYIEIIWRATNTLVTMKSASAGTSPTRPSIPSVIATMNLVATDGAGTSNYYSIYASSQGQGTATISHFANSTANKTYRYAIIG